MDLIESCASIGIKVDENASFEEIVDTDVVTPHDKLPEIDWKNSKENQLFSFQGQFYIRKGIPLQCCSSDPNSQT